MICELFCEKHHAAMQLLNDYRFENQMQSADVYSRLSYRPIRLLLLTHSSVPLLAKLVY